MDPQAVTCIWSSQVLHPEDVHKPNTSKSNFQMVGSPPEVEGPAYQVAWHT